MLCCVVVAGTQNVIINLSQSELLFVCYSSTTGSIFIGQLNTEKICVIVYCLL